MLVTIGIPCYQNVSAETLQDYMRLAYYCGRRMPKHDFQLAIKSKSEQFRARNAIVEVALQTGSDYLFFLDDDHVIDWEDTPGPHPRYSMVETLLNHLESDEKMGICGALYYHRGGECRPVLMKKGNDGGFYWLREDQIIGDLQEVAVQGGGCMMLKMSMFDKLKAPWFEPEFDLGTDLQICSKAIEAGYKVCCDTSIKIGHVLNKREVVTPQNRHRIATENATKLAQGDEGIDNKWKMNSALQLYRMDAEEYLGMQFKDMKELAMSYDMADIANYRKKEEYYASKGKEQLARQVWFHHTDGIVAQMEQFLSMIDTNREAYGLDFGCGSAPIGMELVLRGHKMDFVDIDGSGAYEFTKWRAGKRGLLNRVGFKLGGPYNYILFMDSLEHVENWKEVLTDVCSRLMDGGAIVTNYWLNQDYDNPEHITMNKKDVEEHLMSLGVYPYNQVIWVKKDLGFMDKKKEAENADTEKGVVC